jgi:uncharacterized membrane protein YkvA (DUF1232 family)
MKIQHLRALIKSSGLSPEDLGEVAGISGMTIRRWLKQPDSARIQRLYVPAFREACFALVAKGNVRFEQAEVQAILSEADSYRAQAVMAHLGLSNNALKLGDDSDQMLVCLNQIGLQKDKQLQVDAGEAQLSSLKKLGQEWSRRISTLWEIVRSKEIRPLDKLVAYGALFYLITPFDLIPDNIPVIGYMDDFIILGLAVSYYATRTHRIKKAKFPK